MDLYLILAIVVALIIIALGIFAIRESKRSKRPTDYYSLFVIGVVWLIFGLPTGNEALSVIGAVFVVIGLFHRDKWKKNRVRWSDLSEREKKTKYILIITLAVLLVAGVLAFLLAGGTF